ncbi:hypothetical protein I6G76_02570 [Bacillus cereus]|nr:MULTISPECIES: hypothetical protein [Bacillus cereus group]HDR7632418.1 hypothetical protein [Bacillus mycoides]AJI27854.1 hypothetical protein BF28_1187 [Bacillus cereus E33L]MED1608690.1 hypothetical protein [Bacillus paranthracis]MED1682803.1 hypothetical protein [Bacillus paranthracis]QQA21882.1 hypothetical protein I6G76_02570 [Bacillus cereus]
MFGMLGTVFLIGFAKGLVSVVGVKMGTVVGNYLYKKAKIILFPEKDKDDSRNEK